MHEMPRASKPTMIPTGDEALLLMPRDRRRTYNVRKLLKHVLDKDSFFEIAPLYGRARAPALAASTVIPSLSWRTTR